MRIVPEKQVLPLTAESIDRVSLDFQEFLTGIGTPRKNMVLARLTLEDILLDLREHFGETAELTYIKSSFFSRPSITLSVQGEPFNPLETDEEDELYGNRTSTLAGTADGAPLYSYEHGINAVTLKFSKKSMNPLVKLLIAVACAVLISGLRVALPATAIDYIKNDFLTPLNNTFIGLMATVELPLVFFSVACGILGIGNSAVFGRIGRKMVLYFLRIVFIMTTVAGLIFILLFRLSYGNINQVHLHGGIEMLLNIIPKSLIEPFTGGNSMQIVVMAVIIASVMVMLGERAKGLTALTNEANSVIIHITGLISKLLPFFIFIVLLNLIWSDDLHLILNMWRPLAAFAGVLVFCTAVMFAYVSFRESVSVITLVRKIMPTFLIGLVTASSVALNGELFDCLTAKFGVNRRFAEFGQPIGSVVFMPSTAVNFLICSVYLAYYYKIQVSALWLVIAVLLCAFVAVATPPVPGGAIAAYSIIFTQLGIPASGVAVMISLDILFDFLATAFDSAFLGLAMVRVASKTGMMNYDILRKGVQPKEKNK
ncbi:MAG: cation:dicarboxylase symporter family transporter [Clostridia bacterium]|nr:cation:dicarboxylase symporter family transporter [Clostridia bacterium]